jgi:hypothetical protein
VLFSNYDAADMLVKASRTALFQRLRWANAASYQGNSVYNEVSGCDSCTAEDLTVLRYDSAVRCVDHSKTMRDIPEDLKLPCPTLSLSTQTLHCYY